MTVFTTSRSRIQRIERTALPHRLLLAGGFAFTCLLSNPAQATDQYCTSKASFCQLSTTEPFTTSSDTYFWSPAVAPIAGANTIDLRGANLNNKITQITLRGSSNLALNATGNSGKAEILIGSLGSNILQGLGAPSGSSDTYVVGNPPANVNCQGSGITCRVSGSQGSEKDNVLLQGGTNVIYIDRCMQMTAPNPAGPGKGGLAIANAVKAASGDANYPAITDVAGTCPVASLNSHSLQDVAQRGRDALLSPWERLWSATARWGQGLQWLQQSLVALIEGPRAQAVEVASAAGGWKPPARHRVASFEGVTRVTQNDPSGNFLVAGDRHGNTIVVNSGNRLFNQQILRPTRSNSSVYKQIGSEPVPLNRGIVFVYHEPIGVLAAYPNDRYPYGSERNQGSVIAQLVLGDGSALPASAIDYVLLRNLNQCEGHAPHPTSS